MRLPPIAIALALTLPTSNAAGADAMHHGADHAHHRQMLTSLAERPAYRLSHAAYQIPDVTLVDAHGAAHRLPDWLDADGPLVLSFIYTSCPTICPVLSATLAQAQGTLATEPHPPRLVSISIDPEYDTPQRLRDYAERHGAGPRWHFLTGDPAAVSAVQRAFDAYRGDKTNHIPLTLLRASAAGPWMRLDGFTSAADLVAEYRRLAAP